MNHCRKFLKLKSILSESSSYIPNPSNSRIRIPDYSKIGSNFEQHPIYFMNGTTFSWSIYKGIFAVSEFDSGRWLNTNYLDLSDLDDVNLHFELDCFISNLDIPRYATHIIPDTDSSGDPIDFSVLKDLLKDYGAFITTLQRKACLRCSKKYSLKVWKTAGLPVTNLQDKSKPDTTSVAQAISYAVFIEYKKEKENEDV